MKSFVQTNIKENSKGHHEIDFPRIMPRKVIDNSIQKIFISFET